jgi:two-component system phosphate regulon sensor histidine kinase PhoR
MQLRREEPDDGVRVRRSPWAATLVAIAGPAAVSLLAFTDVSTLPPAFLYLLAIVAATAAGGLWFGLLAGLLSFLGLNYFFTGPTNAIGFSDAEDAVSAVCFGIAAVIASELVDRQARSRMVAEEALERASRLQSAAEALAEAVTPEQVLDSVLTEGVRAAEARAGLIALVTDDGESLEVVAYRGYRHDRIEPWTRFPIAGNYPLSEAVRTGEGVFLRSQAELVKRFPEMQLEGEPMHALVCLPLIIEGRAIGGLTFSFGIDQDFNERRRALKMALARQAAQALERARLYRELERRGDAARALAWVQDGVVLVDRRGLVRYWNAAAEQLAGKLESDALGRPVGEALADWETIEAHLDPVAAGTGLAARPVTVPLERSGEERWVAVAAVAFDQGTVYTIRDVTEEHRLEQDRSDFVATASHELRTPLAAVYGAVRTLRRDDIDVSPDDRENLLEIIETESNRLSGIVGQILLSGQVDAGAIQIAESRCDLPELVEGVLASARVRAPEGLRFEIQAPEDLPPVACDPDKLRQVLVNLLENAVKYSPGSDEVTVALSTENGVARIAVKDYGLGIPAEERQRIFEKFHRLDPAQSRGVGGSGLGLYISRGLVERMGGRIDVDSAPGRGSTFTVELPIH